MAGEDKIEATAEAPDAIAASPGSLTFKLKREIEGIGDFSRKLKRITALACTTG